MIPKSDLVVVMPIYNEEANIRAVFNEWAGELQRLKISFVFLAVNDGSTDCTRDQLAALANAHPEMICPIEKINAGHGRACRTGYDLAVEGDSPWVLQIDSDGQCDPRYFSSFWSSREEAECIFGIRISRDDGPIRTLLSAVCRLAASLFCGIDLKDANVPYRLIQTQALKQALARIPEDFDMQNVALTVALKRDCSLRWKYIPIHFRNRQEGTNSINLTRILRMGWKLIRNLHRITG